MSFINDIAENKLAYAEEKNDIYRLLLEKMSPKDCLVVEDAEAGIDAAIACGMDSAAVGDAVNSNRATYNLEQFSDLLDIIYI